MDNFKKKQATFLCKMINRNKIAVFSFGMNF
jgi:hypothetical protein